MCIEVPKFIKEICPECNPRSYEKTLAEFTGKTNVIELTLEDGSKEYGNEHLYKCCKCGALMWSDEQWVKRNAVIENEIPENNNGTMEINVESVENDFYKVSISRPFGTKDIREFTEKALGEYLDAINSYCEYKGYELVINRR